MSAKTPSPIERRTSPGYLFGNPGSSNPENLSISAQKAARQETAVRRALLVEDNRADVLLVQEVIEFHALPLSLEVASDGEQAFARIEQLEADPHGEIPDLIMLDLNLPKRTGKEVLQRLRASSRLRNVAVLIVSSSDLTRDREELSRLGADRYFRKPTSFAEFMKLGEVMAELLNSRRSS